MTAAMAHEVAQPLAAVTLNASAGLDWLSRKPPNTVSAIESLRTTIDAGKLTFDVLKSLRAMSAKERGSQSEFDLNDLVRETTSLFGRELAAHRITLQLALERGLPAICANRVQIQRVLINLMTNAIEAVSAARRRIITISSTYTDSRNVLLEVNDSGAGIAPEKMDHIFEPFFTSKSNGTGLGLSLSRTIVEQHGGSLWASEDAEAGAIFHLQMPRSPLTTH
jgi:C4-dicarboxylate-specific signal transduction histidine kinase